jgi:hypothetical protein
MRNRNRPADAAKGDRQLSACVLGLAYDRIWVDSGRAAIFRSSLACASLPI